MNDLEKHFKESAKFWHDLIREDRKITEDTQVFCCSVSILASLLSMVTDKPLLAFGSVVGLFFVLVARKDHRESTQRRLQFRQEALQCADRARRLHL